MPGGRNAKFRARFHSVIGRAIPLILNLLKDGPPVTKETGPHTPWQNPLAPRIMASKANRLRLLRVRIMEELRQDLATLTQKIAAVVERL